MAKGTRLTSVRVETLAEVKAHSIVPVKSLGPHLRVHLGNAFDALHGDEIQDMMSGMESFIEKCRSDLSYAADELVKELSSLISDLETLDEKLAQEESMEDHWAEHPGDDDPEQVSTEAQHASAGICAARDALREDHGLLYQIQQLKDGIIVDNEECDFGAAAGQWLEAYSRLSSFETAVSNASAPMSKNYFPDNELQPFHDAILEALTVYPSVDFDFTANIVDNSEDPDQPSLQFARFLTDRCKKWQKTHKDVLETKECTIIPAFPKKRSDRQWTDCLRQMSGVVTAVTEAETFLQKARQCVALYGLWINGEVKYIGKTTTGANRFRDGHACLAKALHPDFDGMDKVVRFFNVDGLSYKNEEERNKLLCAVEQILIGGLRPQFNDKSNGVDAPKWEHSCTINFARGLAVHLESRVWRVRDTQWAGQVAVH